MGLEEIVAEEEAALKSIEDSKKRAEDMMGRAKEKAKAIMATQREQVDAILKRKEEDAKKEAEKVIASSKERAKKIGGVPEKLFYRAVKLVVERVLRVE